MISEQVTTTIDKTEYEQGKEVKITIKNYLTNEVCFPKYQCSSCWKLPFKVERFVEEKKHLEKCPGRKN